MWKKFLGIFIVGITVPVILICLLLSTAYYRNSLQNSYDIVKQNMENNLQVIEERFNRYKRQFYEYIVDSEFIQLAKEINSGDDNVSISAKKSMNNMFSANIFYHKNLDSIIFISDSGDYNLYSRSYGSDIMNTSIWENEEIRNEVLSRVEREDAFTYIAPFNVNNKKTKNCILIAFPVRKLVTQEHYGVLVFALEPEAMLMNRTSNDKETEYLTVVTDQDGTIIAMNNKAKVNEKLDDVILDIYGSRDMVEIITMDIPNMNYHLVSILDKSAYTNIIIRQMLVILIIVFLIVTAILMIVLQISNRYIQRVGTIADAMINFDPGNQLYLNKGKNADEMDIIAERFNEMSLRIREKNEEIVEMTQKQRDAQIKALEAQINPHFLYNTLDVINWKAIENDEDEISNMLGMLGSLLRYSVSNIDKLVILQAELAWLDKYMFLQKERFHNTFDWKVQATEEAREFPIYKMLLQPILENAILHAFENLKSGGMIEVKAFVREDGRLQISVKDNGRGLTEEEMEMIQNQIAHKDKLDSKSIGISNIINRLWTYYGEEADLSVSSEPGKGTEFILIIPKAV